MIAILRILAWILAVALIALPVVAIVNGWIGAERWPLRTLRVNEDLQRVDVQKLRATVLPYAQKGFFAVRLADAQAAVAQLPWVERAEVRKRWPDVLEVRVLEHRPFARWGDDRLLSQAGRLFPRKGIELPKGLPELRGPDTRVVDVVALYNEARALFAPTGLDVRALALDRRGSWALTLSNGTEVVIGSHEARLRLTRFARLLPQLLTQDARPLTRADLRYTNGFALSWGDAARPQHPAAANVSGRAVSGERSTAAVFSAHRSPLTAHFRRRSGSHFLQEPT
jgi:cell division protein FtsQ